jgi:hypothetical protein
MNKWEECFAKVRVDTIKFDQATRFILKPLLFYNSNIKQTRQITFEQDL